MQCRAEGNYRGIIRDYGLKEMDSGAIAIVIRAELHSRLDNGQWVDCEPGMTCDGDLWILRKDNGGPNQPCIESLVNHTGWDASIASIVEQTWHPTPCQLSVKGEEYRGKVYYKIAFVNAFNRQPSNLMQITPMRARELADLYDRELSSFRPTEPPGTGPLPEPQDSIPAGAQPPGGRDIPF